MNPCDERSYEFASTFNSVWKEWKNGKGREDADGDEKKRDQSQGDEHDPLRSLGRRQDLQQRSHGEFPSSEARTSASRRCISWRQKVLGWDNALSRSIGFGNADHDWPEAPFRGL
jgi:hypothetical protein